MDAIVEQGPFCEWELCQAPLSTPPRPGCGSCYAHANGTWIGPAPGAPPVPKAGTTEARELLGRGRPLDAAAQQLIADFTAPSQRSALEIARDLAAACRKGPVAFQIQAAHLAREAEDLVGLLDDPGKVVDLANPTTHHVLVVWGRREERRQFDHPVSALSHVLRSVGAVHTLRVIEDIDDATGAVVDLELRAYNEGVAAYFRASPADMSMARAIVGI